LTGLISGRRVTEVTDKIDVEPPLKVVPDEAPEALEPDAIEPPVGNLPQLVDGFQVPFPYEVWGDGLYIVVRQPAVGPDDDDAPATPPPTPSLDRTVPTGRRARLQAVCSKPIWIRRFGRDMQTREDLVELAYRDLRHNQDTYLWVSRGDVSDWRDLVKFASRGLPINSGNAPRIVAYLDKAVAKNARRLQWVDVSRRVGAIMTDSGWGWLMGHEWIGPPGTNIVPDPTLETDFAASYGVSGDQQEWLDKFEEIASVNPVARWLCYSSFAGPLLRHVNRRTFVIHHWGKTGGGKSALAKFGQSAWGEADGLTETFNRTQKSFTEMFEHTSDFPITFDEMQASGADDDLGQVVYALTLEKGRRRSRKMGGLQKAAEKWRTVVRTNGEEPLVGRGQTDRGGQANRVVQMAASALNSGQAGALHRWLEDGHYGWGGKIFLTKFRDVLAKGGQPLVLQQFSNMRQDIMRPDYEPLGDRVGHLAVVALAHMMAAHWLFGADPKHARAQAIRDAEYIAELLLEDAEQSPTAASAALQILRDHADGEASQWLDPTSVDGCEILQERRWGRMMGILRPDVKEVWVLQAPSNRLLQARGLVPRAVWRDLRDCGTLVTRDRRSLSVVRQSGAFRNRVYVLKWDDFFSVDSEDDLL